jgi:hypothetical protein
MKYTRFIFILLLVLFIGVLPTKPVLAQAPPASPCSELADGEYCPLSNLQGTGFTDGQGKVRVDLKTLLPTAVKFLIGISGLLAVVMIMIGGVKYLTSEAITGKSNAKETIQQAVWGLVLVIGAYTILNTLNPDLVNLNFNIKPLEIGRGFGSNLGSTTPITVDTPDNGTVTTVPGASYGNKWPDDEAVRSRLRSYGFTLNRDTDCQKIGDQGCTSVYGLNPKIVTGLAYLANNCKCSPMITGGTEYWLHGNASTEIDKNKTDHKPGGIAVDLSLNTGGVADFLRKNGRPSTGDACPSKGSERYIYGGGIYVNETSSAQKTADHWHVCFF